MAIATSRRAHPAPARPSTRPAPAATALGLVVATLAGGGLALGLALRAFSLVAEPTAPTVDALVEIAVCGVGALVAGWLAASAVVALACLAVRLVGSSWRLGERMVHRCAPAVVRRALVLAVASSVGIGGATGACAVEAPAPAPSATTVAVATDDLGWVVTTPAPGPTGTARSTQVAQRPAAEPPRPSASATTPSAPPANAPGTAATTTPVDPASVPAPPAPPGPRAPSPTAPRPPRAAGTGTVVVAAGDSLWAIAERHLAPDATDAEIAASWPAWYRANAATIGPDPDLIVPGQRLTVPDASDGTPS